MGDNKGFTLLEVLAAVTAFSLVLAAFFAFYWGILRVWNRETSAMDLQQNARIAAFEIVRELRYAQACASLGNLPLYDDADNRQTGAQKIIYTSSKGESCEIVFNKNKRSITHKIGSGTNELAYNIEEADFFRYIPQGLQGGDSPVAKPAMLLFRLKVQEKEKGVAPGVVYVLQSSLRLQNIVKDDS